MAFTKIEHYEKEYTDTHHDSALNVTQGVEDQPIVNPYFKRKRRRTLSTDEYVEGILNRNITILSQAITLIESNNPDHYAQAQ
jgi:LAO/AO transport system kinase